MPRGTDLDLSDGYKTCPKCLTRKPLSEFYKTKGTVHGYGVYCKPCQRDRHEIWRKQNLPRMAAHAKKWRDENPRLAKDHSLRARYGVPLGWYDVTLAAQEGKCACCDTNDPGGRGDFHVDHCHTTNQVRGLLCNGCNIGIGHLQHSIPVLEAAIRYLTRRLS